MDTFAGLFKKKEKKEGGSSKNDKRNTLKPGSAGTSRRVRFHEAPLSLAQFLSYTEKNELISSY